ncbi:recombination protein NinG [bacterium]|nr:recombination protein NinG [bacterium]
MPKRKCKSCQNYVEEFIKLPAGVFCNIDHAISFANDKQQKAREKARKVEVKEWKQETKRRKISAKSVSEWSAELQSLINKYVRLRDIKDGCISCDKPASWQGQWHCSHYFSRGHSSSLRFNLWNMHKSCSVCNSHLSGNIEQYTPRLIEKIGSERYQYLVAHKSDIARYNIPYLQRAIKVTKRAVKRLERRL